LLYFVRDDCTRQAVGNQGHVMASLKNLAIGLLRRAGFTNLAHGRHLCATSSTKRPISPLSRR
jgi:hypothetical protein